MATRKTKRTRPGVAAPAAAPAVKPPTPDPLPLMVDPVFPKEIEFVATCTVKVTAEIAAKNGMTSRFLAPDDVVKMTREEAKCWVDSGSFESLAKRRLVEEAANYDKDLGE